MDWHDAFYWLLSLRYRDTSTTSFRTEKDYSDKVGEENEEPCLYTRIYT